VDRYCQGYFVLGQSRPLQSDSPLYSQHHRAGTISGPEAAPCEFWWNRYFTYFGIFGNNIFADICGEEYKNVGNAVTLRGDKMKITPVDVQQKQFRMRFRGFDVHEVDNFLEEIAEALEEFCRENKLQKEEIQRLRREVQQYEEREKSFKRAMMNAQKVLDEMKGNAAKEAELVVSEAEVKAEKILNAAHNRLAQIHEDISELKRQRVQFEVQFRSLLDSYAKVLDVDKEDIEALEAAEDKLKFLKKGQ
jgi:cell division initiation protein